MATHTGKTRNPAPPHQTDLRKVADLSQYRDLLEQLPAEQREQLNGVEFDGETVRMDAPSIGQIVFRISERTAPTHVGFVQPKAALRLFLLNINLKEEGPESTVLTPAIKIEIPRCCALLSATSSRRPPTNSAKSSPRSSSKRSLHIYI